MHEISEVSEIEEVSPQKKVMPQSQHRAFMKDLKKLMEKEQQEKEKANAEAEKIREEIKGME